MKNKLTLCFSFIILVFLIACKKDNNNDDDNAPVEESPLAKEAQYVYKTNFMATWEGLNNADGYLIDVSTSAEFKSFPDGFQAKDVGDVEHCFVFGLDGNTTYYYRIKAYQGTSQSPYSNTVAVTTGLDDQLPNQNFEYWTQYTNYEDPSPRGIWATPNKLVDLLPEFYPSVTLKTEDAFSGQYAVKVITDSVQGLPLLSGTLATGIFEVNLGNPSKSLTRGIPYFSKPDRFTGYYKYFPADEDSCQIYAQLSRWDGTLKKRILIGEARLPNITDEVTEYTLFDLEFEYLNSLEPDSISVVFVSSAGGEVFVGGVGSELYVDDIQLVFDE